MSLLTVCISHCSNLINIFEELYSSVTGLPPNTHIVASRCADRGIHLHSKRQMLSELLTALVSWQVSSVTRFLFSDKLLLQSNPTLAAVHVPRVASSVKADQGYFSPLLLVSWSHQFYSEIIHYCCCYYYFIMSYCGNVDSKLNGIFKSYEE